MPDIEVEVKEVEMSDGPSIWQVWVYANEEAIILHAKGKTEADIVAGMFLRMAEFTTDSIEVV